MRRKAGEGGGEEEGWGGRVRRKAGEEGRVRRKAGEGE